MAPLFGFYCQAAPLAKARARIYHQVDGVYFPETMTALGTYSNGDYGWDRRYFKPNQVLCPAWLFGIGLPNLETGVNTYRRRLFLDVAGWTYDGQCAALLGMTDEARR